MLKNPYLAPKFGRKMEKLPHLPIGQQYFASIRKDNGIYVDKTEYIYNLCAPLDRNYFLSRPRRFGKSLTLDNTLERMKFWYDGYSWDGQTFMYNPFSVLNFFDCQQYRNFWFETGTPTFLLKLLRQRFEYKLEQTEVSDLILESITLEKFDQSDVSSLLLQTGYLTIREMTEDNTFILDYPNEEVKRAFAQLLLSQFTETPKMATYGVDILRALRKEDIGSAIKVINDLIQAVPDQNYIKNEEKFFHAIVHLIFTMIRSDVRSEVHTPIGRIDTLVRTTNRLFLFEFKVNESADDALKCIEDRRYAESLRYLNLPITGIGVAFSPKIKGIQEWKQKEF